jgi:hypothetical protein
VCNLRRIAGSSETPENLVRPGPSGVSDFILRNSVYMTDVQYGSLIFLMAFVSSVLAMLRVLGYKSKSFQAISHIWVGILIGSWICTYNKFAVFWTVAISLVELGTFIYNKGTQV